MTTEIGIIQGFAVTVQDSTATSENKAVASALFTNSQPRLKAAIDEKTSAEKKKKKILYRIAKNKKEIAKLESE